MSEPLSAAKVGPFAFSAGKGPTPIRKRRVGAARTRVEVRRTDRDLTEVERVEKERVQRPAIPSTRRRSERRCWQGIVSAETARSAPPPNLGAQGRKARSEPRGQRQEREDEDARRGSVAKAATNEHARTTRNVRGAESEEAQIASARSSLKVPRFPTASE